jgi:membrane protein implicated in regulation of membrane protease activity
MELFIVLTAIGVILFVLSIFADVDHFIGDGILPGIAALLSFFGVAGIITTGLPQNLPLSLALLISTAVGLASAGITVLTYRGARRLGDGKHNDTPPASALIGRKAQVIWWAAGRGEVNMVVSGTFSRVAATGPTTLVSGAEVFVVDAPTSETVVVALEAPTAPF